MGQPRVMADTSATTAEAAVDERAVADAMAMEGSGGNVWDVVVPVAWEGAVQFGGNGLTRGNPGRTRPARS